MCVYSRIYCCTRYDDPQFWPFPADFLQQTEQQVRICTSLMCFIDLTEGCIMRSTLNIISKMRMCTMRTYHNYAITTQQGVYHCLSKQHSVCQILDPGPLRIGKIFETNTVSDLHRFMESERPVRNVRHLECDIPRLLEHCPFPLQLWQPHSSQPLFSAECKRSHDFRPTILPRASIAVVLRNTRISGHGLRFSDRQHLTHVYSFRILSDRQQ